MKWIVRARVALEHRVEADTKAEAERLADGIGDALADYIWKPKKDGSLWTAKKES